jgi:putative oxidoreductase
MMKYATIAARVLLGLAFTAAGLGGFALAFNPPPAPAGLAGAFQSVFFQSHWVLVVDAVEFIAGLALLINRYVPLALTMLAAVLVNILTFHITMMPAGIVPGLILTSLWVVVTIPLRDHFRPLLTSRMPGPTP